MSNFAIFEPGHLSKLLEPFAPGMSQHITPIKYEALSPDLFALLFRTTGRDGGDHYFVSLEFNHIAGVVQVQERIQDWHGKVIRFMQPSRQGFMRDPGLQKISAVTEKPYYAVLAEVERPSGDSYWANNIVIRPGDRIADKIAGFDEGKQGVVRQMLDRIFSHEFGDGGPVPDYVIVNDVNKSNVAVAFYFRPNGEIEYFYNYHTI